MSTLARRAANAPRIRRCSPPAGGALHDPRPARQRSRRWPSITCDSWASGGRRTRRQRTCGCEYERIWLQLGNRPIEELFDLPLMSRSGRVGDDGRPQRGHVGGLQSDMNLRRLVIGRMVNLSLEHGNSDASCVAYAMLGAVLGPRIRRLQGRVSIRPTRPRIGGKSAGWTASRLASTCTMGPCESMDEACPHGLMLVRHAFDAAKQAGDLKCAVYSRATACHGLSRQRRSARRGAA